MSSLEHRRKKNKGYWIWCLFDIESNNFINKISNEQLFKGPSFTPHLTICGPTSKENIIKNKNALKSIFHSINRTSLNIEKLNFSNDFYKAVYFEITNNNEISNLYKLVSETLGIKNYNFDPHISLYYGSINKEIKEFVKTFINLSTQKIFLKNLAVFYVDEKNEIWDLIEILD